MKIIRASAGSGKTYRLAYEYIHTVVDVPSRYRSVLAVTFTNKATEEMKSRVVNELDGLSRLDDHPYMADLCRSLKLSPREVKDRAAKALAMILHDYSRFGIMTIDRFFQKIVRGFVRELDLQSDYGIDLNTDYLLSLAVDSLIDSTGHDAGRRRWITGYIDGKIAEGKGRDVKKELTDFAQIILRPEFGSYPQGERLEAMGRYLASTTERSRIIPEQIRKRASDALQVIDAAGLQEADFARKSQGVYGYLAKIASGGDKFAQNRYVTDAREGVASMWKGTEPVRESLIPVLKEMYALNEELTAYRIISRFSREYMILGDISSELDTVLRNNNTMILSLTDSLLSRLTRGNDAPFIYEKSGTMFDTFLIDEFQDTSTEQWGNFAPLINDAISRTEEGRESVVIVGDTKQSIYRWRGGDWRLIEGSLIDAIDRPEVVTVDLLDTNWRSRRNIIRFNNSLMRSVVESCNATLNGRVKAAFDDRRITASQRDGLLDLLDKAYIGMEQGYSPKNSDESGSVVLRLIGKEKGESVTSVRKRALDAMVADIERLQDAGYSASEMAILVRTTKEARTVASYLLDYKRENPDKRYCYEVVSSEALSVGGAPVVRFVLAAFGLALNGDDRMSLASFNDYLGRDMSQRLDESDSATIETLRSVSLEEAFELLCRRYSLGDDSRGVAYLQAFHSILLSFSGQAADIPSFMDMWSHHGDKRYIALPEGQDSITVQTIHKAKGLEYDVLFMPFASWELGLKSGSKIRVTEPAEGYEQADDLVISAEASLADSPFAYSYLREEVMNVIESVNTLYVALTRAADHLIVNVLPDINGSDNVGALIAAAVRAEGDRAFIRN
ncbi:MAG: UvrD-helicase domain-containing protein [Rikenellaceae bacterium]|nr:UvrD-helicase domain-containing protein [Rikenellaceae bacterium]